MVTPAFLTPKKPTYTSGMLVIESDDGYTGDYTHWLREARLCSEKYSQWGNSKAVVCCPNVNSGTVGTSGIMTPTQLRELQNKYGWEIMSHGKWHAGLGRHPLVSGAAAGQRRIDVFGTIQLPLSPSTGYTYKITEGTKTELVRIISKEGGTYDAGHVITESDLVNSYTAAATLELSEASIRSELNNCISELTAWGLDVKNHVYTYHSGADSFPNSFARSIVAELFDSARGIGGTFNDSLVDPWRMRAIISTNDKTVIDNALNYARDNNGVFIFYGHGETGENPVASLRYLMEGALSRGIRIGTRKEALEYLNI